MNIDNITKGECTIVEHSWSDTSIMVGDKTIFTISIYDEATEDTQDELMRESDANCELIQEAFNVAHGYNLSPAQLLQQNKELREALESKWISVEDRLPENGMPVLIYDDGIGIGLRRDKRFFGLDVYKYEHNVTYWMPLPQNPIKTP